MKLIKVAPASPQFWVKCPTCHEWKSSTQHGLYSDLDSPAYDNNSYQCAPCVVTRQQVGAL